MAGYRTGSVRLGRRATLDTVRPPLLPDRTLPPPSDGVDSPGAARRERPGASPLAGRGGREELSRLAGWLPPDTDALADSATAGRGTEPVRVVFERLGCLQLPTSADVWGVNTRQYICVDSGIHIP